MAALAEPATAAPVHLPTSATPGSASSTRRGHIKRLSLSVGSPASSGEAHTGDLASLPFTSPPPSSSLFTPDRQSLTSPTLARLGGANAPASPSPTGSTYSLRRSHNRRQSSISYNRDPSIASPISPRAPLSIQPAIASSTPQRSSFDSARPAAASPVPPSPTSGISAVRPGSASGPATAFETHGDLLSFIARKERKVLELKEELKRHEDELKQLKSKWETIVAREIRSPPTPAATPASPALSSPRLDAAASPSLGRRHGAIRHSIAGPIPDLGAPSSPQAQPDALPDLGSAKRYIGGLVKSSMAGMSGLLEGLAQPPTDLPDVGGTLGAVREEDEEEEETDDRRPSSASSAGISEDDGHFSSATRESSASSLASSKSSDDTATAPALVSSSSASGSDDTLTTAEDIASSPRPPPSSRATFGARVDKSHARRRSAFDMFGSGVGSLTGSIGRKFGELAQSDTFKTSKRATLNFVDTFERTLTDAISVDDDVADASPVQQPTSPALERQNGALWGAFGARTPAVPAKQSRAPAAPIGQVDLDWAALLDTATATVSPPLPPKSTPSRSPIGSPLLDELDVSSALHATATNSLPAPIQPAKRISPRHAKRMSMPAFNKSAPAITPPSPQSAARALSSVRESPSDDWTTW